MAWSTNRAKSISVVGISAVIAALDWFFMFYITSYNFEVKTLNLGVGGLTFAMPILWLPILGVFLVALVAWYEVLTRIFPRRAGPEIDPLTNARWLRAIAFSVMTFVCVLYIPYLLGSVWFWAKVSKLGHSIPQIQGVGLSILNTQTPVMTINPLWQYSLSQIFATAAMVIVAWAFSRTVRRPRKPR
jgi:hypothetical protein